MLGRFKIMKHYLTIYFIAGEAKLNQFGDEEDARQHLKEVFDDDRGCPDCIIESGIDSHRIVWSSGFELENINDL